MGQRACMNNILLTGSPSGLLLFSMKFKSLCQRTSTGWYWRTNWLKLLPSTIQPTFRMAQIAKCSEVSKSRIKNNALDISGELCNIRLQNTGGGLICTHDWRSDWRWLSQFRYYESQFLANLSIELISFGPFQLIQTFSFSFASVRLRALMSRPQLVFIILCTASDKHETQQRDLEVGAKQCGVQITSYSSFHEKLHSIDNRLLQFHHVKIKLVILGTYRDWFRLHIRLSVSLFSDWNCPNHKLKRRASLTSFSNTGYFRCASCSISTLKWPDLSKAPSYADLSPCFS